MSIYRIIDITPAGAYLNAMDALGESESHARRHAGKPGMSGVVRRLGRMICKSHNLVKGMAERWNGQSLVRKTPEPAE